MLPLEGLKIYQHVVGEKKKYVYGFYLMLGAII